MKRSASVMVVGLLAGCGFSPEPGHWDVSGEPGASGCDVFPALPTSWDVLEADEGFVIAMPGGSATAACDLDRRDFACEPLAFEWRFSDGTVESFLGESLTVSGRFWSPDEASGTVRMDLTCEDEDCPNEGACSANFSFSAFNDLWFGLG